MCRPEARFAEFKGLRTFDANFYLRYFIERSNSVAIETERLSLRFCGSWPLSMDALMSRVIQHLLKRENSYGSVLLRYFSGL